MKIGFIILVYDEINTVSKNLEIINANECISIVIQSDPHNQEHLVDPSTVNHYELLPDVAGSKESYEQEEKEQLDVDFKDVKLMKTPGRALTRNWRKAFSASKQFDVDWWICILGDVHISNLIGIQKIIQKMEKLDKSLGFTRGVGLRSIHEYYGIRYMRTQRLTTTDFFAAFFIVSSEVIQQGLFENIRIINTFEPSTILGDHVKEFCKNNNLNFWDICYSISNYPYPKFIDGLDYNPDRVTLPRIFLGLFNCLRRQRMRFFFPKKDQLLPRPNNYKDWEQDANTF